MKRKLGIILLFCFWNSFVSFAEEGDAVRVQVTLLVASNQGKEFDFVNDAYRDRIVELFSYSAYRQVDESVRHLKKAGRDKVELPGGYELVLTLQGWEKERVLVQALVRKEGRQYVNTVLSILKPGVVFLGGPPVGDQGDLIIVLETGF